MLGQADGSLSGTSYDRIFFMASPKKLENGAFLLRNGSGLFPHIPIGLLLQQLLWLGLFTPLRTSI